MITDSARQKLIPSLAEVLAALKKVHPPYTITAHGIRVQVLPSDDDVRVRNPNDNFDKTLSYPVIELSLMRTIDENGRQCETWSVVSMPEFHL